MKPKQYWAIILKLTILLISSLTLLTGCKKDKETLQNTPPAATSVMVALGSGQATGHYTYTDNEGDEEGNSLFQWYKADDNAGTNEVKIANATAKTYMYQPDDQGAFLAFEVTPVQKDGQTGSSVKSPFTGTVVYDNDDDTPDIELKFLDEFVYPAGQMFQGTTIGGLSGIHYENGVYYIVSDDYNNPRYYKVQIDIQQNAINAVTFTDVITFDTQQTFYTSHFLDLESIVLHNGTVIISSEGSINSNKEPCIFTSNTQGDFLSAYNIPDYFLTHSRHNGVFESLSISIDNQGIWCANELPLTTDGTEAGYPTTHSPLRLTYYDTDTKEATKVFAYELSPLPLPNNSNYDMNGVSDLLTYKDNQFLVVERAFQGKNVVKIFKAVIDNTSTDILNTDNLNGANYIPVTKELIFDFSSIETELTNQRIDNIEGITFGETLPNGNRTIIVISDDNFQQYGEQLNQFILFELIEH